MFGFGFGFDIEGRKFEELRNLENQDRRHDTDLKINRSKHRASCSNLATSLGGWPII